MSQTVLHNFPSTSRLWREVLRQWIVKNLAPFVFLSAFFLTVVIGNFLFTTDYGRRRLMEVPRYAVIYDFPTIFTPLYWLLLFLPFLLVPPIVVLVRRMLGSSIYRWCSKIPEIRILDYVVITCLALGFVGYSLWQAQAFALYGAGSDAVSSVEIRFQILAGLSFWAMAVLMSILPYLAVYALIRCFRRSGLFWIVAAAVVIIIESIYMILLNMKWPFLLFEATLVLTIFSHSKTYPYVKTSIGAVALFAAYLIISVHVFRLDQPVRDQPVSVAKTAWQRAPEMVFAGLTRMATLYPFYYQIFTEEGSVCGGIREQARVGPSCRPSTYVYTRIFGHDGFEGRGTAPAAVHISGYALGGWPIAIFALVCASIILGLLACLPQGASALIGAFGIMGAVAGYHFSQLPGEGPLFYDHGLVWTLIPMIIYVAWRKFFTPS
ncbi:hypothetical protein ACFO0J_01650 [Castellaniella hirudinis]|uniref:Oligosaccharide repeat unit polymerase n=1 Tax=Castellaniella hirudinis TaxID=1144617 RepID=A0ABV8RTZ0_9BURK